MAPLANRFMALGGGSFMMLLPLASDLSGQRNVATLVGFSPGKFLWDFLLFFRRGFSRDSRGKVRQLGAILERGGNFWTEVRIGKS